MTDEFACLVAEYAKQDASVETAFLLVVAFLIGWLIAEFVRVHWWRKMRRALVSLGVCLPLAWRLRVRSVQAVFTEAYLWFCFGLYILIGMVTL